MSTLCFANVLLPAWGLTICFLNSIFRRTDVFNWWGLIYQILWFVFFCILSKKSWPNPREQRYSIVYSKSFIGLDFKFITLNDILLFFLSDVWIIPPDSLWCKNEEIITPPSHFSSTHSFCLLTVLSYTLLLGCQGLKYFKSSTVNAFLFIIIWFFRFENQ